MPNSIKLVAALCFLFSNNVWAAACQFSGSSPIPVVYFGGHNSNDPQAQAWSDAAQANPKYKSYFKFEGHSLHQAGTQQSDVLRASAGDIQQCIDKIKSPTFKGPVVLVGHSDGGWVIKAIAEGLSPADKKKIKVVSLDGYALPDPAFADVDVECWTAYMTEKQTKPVNSCSDIEPSARSLYWHEMVKCKKDSCHVMAESGCASAWCAHFRLANSNASSGINKTNYGDIGYGRVNPPMPYLNDLLPSQRSDIPADTTVD